MGECWREKVVLVFGFTQSSIFGHQKWAILVFSSENGILKTFLYFGNEYCFAEDKNRIWFCNAAEGFLYLSYSEFGKREKARRGWKGRRLGRFISFHHLSASFFLNWCRVQPRHHHNHLNGWRWITIQGLYEPDKNLHVGRCLFQQLVKGITLNFHAFLCIFVEILK